MNVTGPISATSIISTVVTVISVICGLIVLTTYIINRNYAYPGIYIPIITIHGLIASMGFIIGILSDFNPFHYSQNICELQWIFMGFSGFNIFMLFFFYIFGLYEVVVMSKPAKYNLYKVKYIVVSIMICSCIFAFGLPYLLSPHNGLYFGPNGPWCSIASIYSLIYFFYGPIIPFAIVSIYLSIKVVLVVRKVNSSTTKATSNSKIYYFYLRICLFCVVYSIATIGSFIRRILDIKVYENSTINDPTMGIYIMMPIVPFIQGLIFMSIPEVSLFWKSLFRMTTISTAISTKQSFDI
jgi:hypothetical protein